LIVGLRSIEGSVVAHFAHAFIFLSTRPDPRMRFTLAHEVCHYLCDISDGTGNAWFDEDTLNPVGHFRRDEVFANSFASALLLPPTGVGEALNAFRKHHKLVDRDISDVEIMFLARFFGVSFQVAARRLEDLKIVPHGGGQSIYEAINKRFGSPEKFADELGLPARIIYDWNRSNERIVREAHDAIASGKLSVGRLAEIAELPIERVIRSVAQ
jgi:Zn-dependent peptidase ImmA (M78 family)